MKPDENLTELLREYRARPLAIRPNPTFRTSVWQRIEMQESHCAWLSLSRTRLVLAGALCALTLAVSGWSGHATARAQARADQADMATHYLASLDARAQAGMQK